ncbi:MAG TPA: FadR/GntR family transcriptional regulator [Devosiaceae bacterium]|jgi:DNA-binding FadR family transcriptional regulator
MPAGAQQTLSDVVYDQILGLITDGTWPARSRLPSEVELVARFGISRPVVRQALARLRDDGLVTSRKGSGTFVQEQDAAPKQVSFPSISSIADLERFLNFREGVEGEAAASAAQFYSEQRVEELRQAARDTDLGGIGMTAAETDFAFHLAVARASENPFYVNTLMSLKEQILFGMNLARTFSAGSDIGTIKRDHIAVAEAIIARDPAAAREAMRNHLQWSRQRFLTGSSS